jgi:hypothetical protein
VRRKRLSLNFNEEHADSKIQAIYREKCDANYNVRPCANKRKTAGARTGGNRGKNRRKQEKKQGAETTGTGKNTGGA